MSTKELEIWLLKVREFSVDELLTVQKTVAAELKQKTAKSPVVTQNPNHSAERFNEPEGRINIPGAYRPTKAQIEAHLSAIFTPEQRAEFDKVDLSQIKLLPGAKSSTELISEDREDRF